MAAEAEFRALAVAHAPLTALVSTRVALNAAPQGSALPLVAYTVNHENRHTLLGDAVAEDIATIEAQCWANTGAAAQAVADALQAAIYAQTPVRKGWVDRRSTGYDAELDLHAVVLSVQWMD
jgi:hypothetical protein